MWVPVRVNRDWVGPVGVEAAEMQVSTPKEPILVEVSPFQEGLVEVFPAGEVVPHAVRRVSGIVCVETVELGPPGCGACRSGRLRNL